MPKRTKIIATLGPATNNTKTLTDMFSAGVDVVRLNFSHGERSEHAKRIENVRKIAAAIGKHIAILVDLQGPKIRIARFKQNKVTLKNGNTFILDAALADNAGDDTTVGIDYKDLPNDVQANDTLLLNDGLIALTVEKVSNQQIICTVKQGGILSNNKGINRLGGGLSAHGLTDKDKQDLTFATRLDVDYIAISFPRDAADIEQAKQLLAAEKSHAGLIAKIERVEAVEAIAEIIDAADGVMVARGDLGVEIGDAELPGVQKHIINEARSRDKPVITATQMMESMITNPIPTRAEVFDVSNAVLDGTDAVMLSAETATGKHPVKAIEAMARICIGAEKNPISRTSKHRVECHFNRIDEAIAMATMYAANHSDITAIIAMTETGSTPLWMSRIRSGIPVYALCHNPTVLRHMSLYRGVYPIQFDVNQYQEETLNPAAVTALTQQGLIAQGDWVIITRGDTVGVHGHTNSLKIVVV